MLGKDTRDMPAVALGAAAMVWVSWALLIAALLTGPTPPEGLAGFLTEHAGSIGTLAILAVANVGFTLGKSWARVMVIAFSGSAACALVVNELMGFAKLGPGERLVRMAVAAAVVAGLLALTATAGAWFTRKDKESAA